MAGVSPPRWRPRGDPAMAPLKHYARSLHVPSTRVEGGEMEAATADQAPAVTECSSFSKALFLGEIHEGLVFPWPEPDPSEQDRIRALIASVRELGESIDPREIEEKRWIGDELVRELGERGLCGLYVPETY